MLLSARNYFGTRTVIALVAGGSWFTAILTIASPNETSTDEGFVFRTWGTELGLPQNTVNVILQTHDGYLWLGTQAGLTRFDGIRFKVYGLAEGLPNVQVRALHEDAQGSLWIGTYGGGLSRLQDGQIKTFTVENGLSDFNVTALAGDSSGRIWIGTSAGLSLWQNGKFIRDEALAGLGSGLIRTLLRDRHNATWISSSEGLFEFKGGRLARSAGPSGDENFSPYCLLEDRDGNLWAGIGNGKVLCRRNGVWGKYDEAAGVPFAYVTCLAEGTDGTIWAGSLDAGLYYFQAGRFHPINKQSGLSGDAIRALLADQEGNLWIGTRSAGLNRLARRKLTVYGPAQGLAHDFVRSVAETADGSLWVGTTGGGLYRGRKAVFTVFGDDRIRFYANVESVLATRDGSLWWGGSGALFQWRENLLAASYTRTNQPWLGDVAATALAEDPRGGLWIGTGRGGLWHFRDGQFISFPDLVARGAVTALASETDGTLWVGSIAGGLSRVRNGSVETLCTTNGLPSDHIRTLYLDPENTLWIGSGGAGLIRWKQGRIDCFTTRQGLGDDTVSQILEDDNGHLWLGCDRGIFRFRKTELANLADGKTRFVHSQVYGVTDGMPADECANGFSPAGLKLRSGRLCFSTIKGLVVIDPRQQEIDVPPPRVLLEEVMVDRQSQRLRPQLTNNEDSETPPLAITIAPGPREIDFHYTGLNFAAPEKVQFRFRLEGWDRDWVEAGPRRVAYYQQLHPGNYVFRVLACNADGVWSEPGAAMAVTVQAYLWETGWFRALGALTGIGLLAGMVYGVARHSYKQRLTRLETRHAIERERLRISQDMHDAVGGILTRVSILSDLGQSQADGPTAPQQFERIGNQVRAAVVALDEIVWATNPKDDNLPRFAEYVGRFADECFENTPVRCWQEMPTDLPKLPLRSDVRHNVFLAVKEALNNVLKHSGANEVWLRLQLVEANVCVEIEDNGRGFTPERATPGGNGLGNMNSRLAECDGRAELTGTPGKGVKVRFVFPIPKMV